jgi:hypothetical protein
LSDEHQEPELDALARRLPIIGDKAMLDLVNGVSINREGLRYQRSLGFFGRLFESISGGAAAWRHLVDGNLTEGICALSQLVEEILRTLPVRDHAMLVTQEKLFEVRRVVRLHRETLVNHGLRLDRVEAHLESVANELCRRIARHEDRMRSLEIRQAAAEELEAALLRWTAGDTYFGFPVLMQVVFLAGEVFSGAPLEADLRRRDEHFQSVFVRRVLEHLPDVHRPVRLTAELDRAWNCLESSDADMCRALLRDADPVRPMLGLLGATGNLASLGDLTPISPSATALAVWRRNFGNHAIDELVTGEIIVKTLAEEVVDALTASRRTEAAPSDGNQ